MLEITHFAVDVFGTTNQLVNPNYQDRAVNIYDPNITD